MMRLIFLSLLGVFFLMGWAYLWPVNIQAPGFAESLTDVQSAVVHPEFDIRQPYEVYRPIIETPLFEPSRQEWPPQGTDLALPVEESSEAFDDVSRVSSSVIVAGKVSTGKFVKVLIRTGNEVGGTGAWLAEGDIFEGGSVLKIQDAAVVLNLNGEEVSLPIEQIDGTEGVLP